MRRFRFFSGRGNNYVLYLYYIIYGANTLDPRKHHTCKFTTIKIFHSRRRLGRTTPDLCWDRRWRRNRVGSLRKISSGRGETSFPYNTEVTRAQVRRDWTWENSEWSTTEGQDRGTPKVSLTWFLLCFIRRFILCVTYHVLFSFVLEFEWVAFGLYIILRIYNEKELLIC